MISLELLKTFLEAASAGSFRRAASARFVTISAVSQQIKTLETQLGVLLFERLGRRVQLTPEGQAFAASLRPAFTQIDDAVAQMDQAQRAIRGLVRIGTPRAFGAYWVRPRVLALLRAHEGLTVQLHFDVPSILEQRVSDGRLDIALLVRPARLPTVDARPVTEETFLAVAAPAFVERVGMPRGEAAFRALPFAIFDPDLAMHAPWWEAQFPGSSPLPSNVVAEAPSLDELLALTLAGHCACVLPSYWVLASLRASTLVCLDPPDGPKANNPIYLAWRRGAALTARVRALHEAFGA